MSLPSAASGGGPRFWIVPGSTLGENARTNLAHGPSLTSSVSFVFHTFPIAYLRGDSCNPKRHIHQGEMKHFDKSTVLRMAKFFMHIR